ncbi:MAG: site-specific DNA-methyltransferase [Clostridiales bacterium]|nr:site-specific DNA-methyltransferase [Clostridiales bacterium]
MPNKRGCKDHNDAVSGKAEHLAKHNVQKKGRPFKPAHDSRKPLYQAVFASLPTGNSASTAYLHCIKLGTNIDPPYNTGSDFIYADDFTQDSEEYIAGSGQLDDDGNRLVQNTESNGRFHTDWLNMLYPRLRIAKDFLSEDGLICISIDSNEIGNLRKICNEIFGEGNYVTEISVLNNPRGRQSDSFVATVHEYLLCYAKNASQCVVYGMPLTDEQKSEYSYSDEKGAYRLLGLRQRGVASLREDRPEMFFPIYVNPDSLEVSLDEHDGWEVIIPKKSDGREGRWMWGKKKCVDDGDRLVARMIERRNEYDIFVKDYLDRGEDQARTRKYRTIWDDKSINNQVGTQEVKKLLGGEYMSFPKSAAYIQMIGRLGSGKDCVVMDFFSGSATTAQAVMQLNEEDGGNRKFIMVQLQEEIDEKTPAFKAGYKTICDIGEERIRRAGKKIKEESPMTTSNLDIGFRVFKVDTTNMNEVYYRPKEYKQGQMSFLANNIKEDRTPEDLLFQVMLDLGVLLSSKIEEPL